MAVPPDELDHVYSIYINAEPECVWRAITDGAETEQYYYGTIVKSDWSVGSRVSYDYPDGTVAADGEVLACDPPDRKSTRLNSRHCTVSRMPSSA